MNSLFLLIQHKGTPVAPDWKYCFLRAFEKMDTLHHHHLRAWKRGPYLRLVSRSCREFPRARATYSPLPAIIHSEGTIIQHAIDHAMPVRTKPPTTPQRKTKTIEIGRDFLSAHYTKNHPTVYTPIDEAKKERVSLWAPNFKAWKILET